MSKTRALVLGLILGVASEAVAFSPSVGPHLYPSGFTQLTAKHLRCSLPASPAGTKPSTSTLKSHPLDPAPRVLDSRLPPQPTGLSFAQRLRRSINTYAVPSTRRLPFGPKPRIPQTRVRAGGFFDFLLGNREEKEQDSVALPTGWQEAIDDESGQMYYWNVETGESSWTRPEAAAPEVATELQDLPNIDCGYPMPPLYAGWFNGEVEFVGSDGQPRQFLGTNEVSEQLNAAVQAALSDGITSMEVSFPPVPNLEEVDFGTALNLAFSKKMRDELGIENEKYRSEVRRSLVDFSNYFWARRLAEDTLSGSKTYIGYCDQTPKKNCKQVENTWVGRVSTMKQQPKDPGSVSIIVNPGPQEQWKEGIQASAGSDAVIFLNSISGGWTYELGGPVDAEQVYYIKRISKGWVFRQYPGPWQALAETPDGGVVVLEKFEQRPLLRDVAKLVREWSFNKYSIFNDRYAKGFGGRL